MSLTKEIVSTKGTLNDLRKNGFVPGVIYGRTQEPVLISIPELVVNSVVYTSATNIINIQIEDNVPISCILKDVQYDPLTDKVKHFDLHGITVGESIEVQVPVILTGSRENIRKEEGILQHITHKLDIECLPKNIPQQIEIDISDLKIGDFIHVHDLKYDNFTILNSEDVLIVSVTAPKLVEEEEAEDELPGEEITEPEVIGKGKSEESDED